ncbi:GHKL domain-containing protein [Pontibacillus yanchengensis]|uniref:histidine kinase n=1 Tax=Pontibacillus yanchengensis TaxID=462910 RepID=A0A6I4ZUT0_9BACI|nr:HAMP domain-containing sensor histidine kinase [Pontibacillus yanchengensis]MYL33928.1 GHKL domain-containing protein [Pontibacillus yanchengensis]
MKDDKKIAYIALGCFLILFGILFPVQSMKWSSWIYENIEVSLESTDSGRLVMTALSYITWYSITFSFIYMGSMVISHTLSKRFFSIWNQLMFSGIVLASVLTYNHMYHEHYAYIIHFLLLGILLFLMNYIPKQRYFYVTFLLILVFMLFSVQWLNLIPALSNFGFGTDDFAVSMKITDEYLTDQKLFNTFSTILFGVFFLIAIIITTLLHLFSKQMMISRQYQQQTEELRETKGALIETNVYKEIHSLVHDLKSPLVTVEGLISLLSLKVQDEKSQSYFDRISTSLEKMKDMVSEILYEDTKRELEVQELVNYVRSHVRQEDPNIAFHMQVEENLPNLYINKIRFARALSNVLENALRSLKDDGGNLYLDVEKHNQSIQFLIEDDGPGIDAAWLETIWEEGFSTKNSSGIGLPFVKNVVHQHGGTVSMESEPDVYTRVKIEIPVSEKEDEEHDSGY